MKSPTRLYKEKFFSAYEDIPYQDENFYYLYKHIAFDTDLKILNIFDNTCLRFAHPSKFNDPFDGHLVYEIPDNITYGEYYRYLKTFGFPIPTHDMFETHREEYLENIRNRLKENQFHDNSGVCCFNPHLDSILMWSHYANSHTGFAIEFKFPKSDIGENNPLPIYYSDDYPVLEFRFNRTMTSQDYQRELVAKSLAKSTEWSYENEFRLLKFDCCNANEGYKLIKFDPLLINAVILGINTDPSGNEVALRGAVNNFAEKHNLSIPIYKMLKTPRKFQLHCPDHPYFDLRI